MEEKEQVQQFVYLLNGAELLTGFSVERPEYTSEGYPVYSRQLVCPMCCSIWAKLTIPGKQWHIPEAAPCQFCPAEHDREVPGSLIVYSTPTIGLDLDLVDLLPEQFLRREFNLTMKALQK